MSTYRRQTKGKPRRSTVLYRAWVNLWGRVRGHNHDGRGNFRWKGLPVHADWKDFGSFREWAVSHGFSSENRSLDRVDSAKGYSPENCEWVTKTVQGQRAMRVRYA